jgi:hypothetical protein
MNQEANVSKASLAKFFSQSKERCGLNTDSYHSEKG